jgi:hypothetical protein
MNCQQILGTRKFTVCGRKKVESEFSRASEEKLKKV